MTETGCQYKVIEQELKTIRIWFEKQALNAPNLSHILCPNYDIYIWTLMLFYFIAISAIHRYMPVSENDFNTEGIMARGWYIYHDLNTWAHSNTEPKLHQKGTLRFRVSKMFYM